MVSRNYLVSGNVIRDFMSTTGYGWNDNYILPLSLNESLKPEALGFLLEINKLGRNEERFNRKNIGDEKIVKILSKEYFGKLALPIRSEAIAFYKYFESSNERLKLACFPDEKEALFSEDFSMYPEKKSVDASLSVDDAIRLAALLWTRGQNY